MESSEGTTVWDEAAFTAALKLAATGVIEAEGIHLTSDQLDQLLLALPEDRSGIYEDEDDDHEFEEDDQEPYVRPGIRQIHRACFKGATFGGDARFAGIMFTGRADFIGVTFTDKADFASVTVNAGADFTAATFNGHASFTGATFGSNAFARVTFVDARFGARASFNEVGFRGTPAHFQRVTFAGNADFARARFGAAALFSQAQFDQEAIFQGAAFRKEASFPNTTFKAFAFFANVTFGDDVSFQAATFGGNAAFDGASFNAKAMFGRRGTIYAAASFGGHGRFRGTTFDGDAVFEGTTFAGDALFGADEIHPAAAFCGDAQFAAVTFASEADFAGVRCEGDARFVGATLEKARQLGPMVVRGFFGLDRTVFAQAIRIDGSAGRLARDGAGFRAGGDIFARWANVSLEETDFAGPSLLAELPARHRPNGKREFLGWEQLAGDGRWRQLADPPDNFAPRLVSLRRAKVAQLTLSGVDLTACRFAGAYGLDELKLERVRFGQPPGGWRQVAGWRWVRWMPRSTVAEERHWRDVRGYGSGWYEEGVQAPDWLSDASEPPHAEQIAGVYRALRKGREDIKDEPGAADFYYGEMEMRRHSPYHARGASGRSDRRRPAGHPPLVSIIWLYWLVSGYGLRASRALVAFVVMIAVLGLGMDLWAFRPDKPYGRALLFAVESSASLLRVPPTKLTASGEVMQIVLRLAGPLFLGLVLLALRGRVKR